ncbi:DUF7919 family protein [Rhizobium paknamense]|uniref:DUF7919 domain-containing protein n=1 Tax=Rhizobium paknamense TaxID=1206817 RepID=A0ABU0IJM4_9HYPH|nr:hypothetical protein [Rhizobium paknamense]MDQ0458442.1 hypothetical protein [Rhizobium paknamense]
MQEDEFQNFPQMNKTATGFTLVPLDKNLELPSNDGIYHRFLTKFEDIFLNHNFKKFICHVNRGFSSCPICGNIHFEINGSGPLNIIDADVWIPDCGKMIIYTFPFYMIHMILNHGHQPPIPFMKCVLEMDGEIDFKAVDHSIY